MKHLFFALVALAFLAMDSFAQCTQALSPVPWVSACDQPAYAGPRVSRVRVSLSCDVERTVAALNTSPLAPAQVTASLCRVRFDVALVPSFDNVFANDVATVVAATHVLRPLSTWSDVASSSHALALTWDVPRDDRGVPLDGVFRRPWTLHVRATGAGSLSGSGAFVAQLDYRASMTSLAVELLP